MISKTTGGYQYATEKPESKLDFILQNQVKETLVLFKKNPLHPSLGNKKISGQKNIYELRVPKNFRITYSKVGNTIFLRKVGKHDKTDRE
ncbi:MAG: hypothetical protein ACYDIA_24205 [Candidatus Humimicrobiaceae bacterium]